MNIQWVVADHYSLDPTADLAALKDIGSFWGGWRTWRSCNTDNVICYDAKRAGELIKNKFNTTCNLYVAESVFNKLDNPANVRAFGSEFQHDVEQADAIVSLFLAASSADIVLLLGFDLGGDESHDTNYIYQAFVSYPDTQFVLIDHGAEMQTKFTDLENVMQDTLSSVIKMLK